MWLPDRRKAADRQVRAPKDRRTEGRREGGGREEGGEEWKDIGREEISRWEI